MDKRNILLFAGVAALATILFVVDLLVPLGVAVWLPYVAVVLVSLWFPQRWPSYATAMACTILIILGLIIPDKEGGFFWLAVGNRLLGIFALWITAFIGLAARRTLELQEANKRLQQEILERERLQGQLLRTQRLESVGVLASGIAHDFNNLLTPILMAAKLLREDRADDERKRLLTVLQASAERGAEMVAQLLSFAGGVEGQRAPVQVAHIIKEINSILGHTFPKNIDIRTEVPSDLLAVLADATQLSQVVMNLCVNARDALPGGGVLSITATNVHGSDDLVRGHVGAEASSYVRIAVADTGIGIEPNLLEKVFDPFFTTKERGKGTGLGLSTALGIVRSHGGFIAVDSEVGKGSTFSVYLPAMACNDERPVNRERAECSKRRGERILIVDDEPFIIETVQATLEASGYTVLTATEGREAIKVYEEHRDDIQAVLLDMMMPGMDGPTTIAAIERLDPHARIIASSGLRTTGQVADDVASGKRAFLPKPFTSEALLATLDQVLRKDQE